MLLKAHQKIIQYTSMELSTRALQRSV